MSGGIAQLVAVGAQDVHLVGQPKVSFFRSTYVVREYTCTVHVYNIQQ
jgi:hypothetical protein